MLKKILLVVAVLIVGLGALIASRPEDFVIERTATFSAPPEAAFAQVNDFKKWAAWSPWENKDPAMKKSYGGPETGGVGATYSWEGNGDVGVGKMTILESKPAELIKIQLDFTKPFEDTSTVSYIFAKDGEGTKVTWKMEGKNNFISKAFSLVMDMDKMVGGDFEKGLASMKAAAEAHAARAKAEAEAAAQAEADKKAAEEAAAAAAPAP